MEIDPWLAPALLFAIQNSGGAAWLRNADEFPGLQLMLRVDLAKFWARPARNFFTTKQQSDRSILRAAGTGSRRPMNPCAITGPAFPLDKTAFRRRRIETL
jgi:hypothetical protein